MVQLSHPYMTTGKTTALTIWTFVDKVMSLIFNTLSRFVTAFLPRTGNFMPVVTICSDFEPKKIKSMTVSLSICHDVMGPDALILDFSVLSFKPAFSFSFTFIKRLFSSSSVQFSSVAQSCPTLYDPMDCSPPGFPVHHQIMQFTQTHVHWVGDAIQPSHPLSSPSPSAFNHSWHQGLFKWVSSSHQVDKVLKFHLQHQSFQWIFRTDFL